MLQAERLKILAAEEEEALIGDRLGRGRISSPIEDGQFGDGATGAVDREHLFASAAELLKMRTCPDCTTYRPAQASPSPKINSPTPYLRCKRWEIRNANSCSDRPEKMGTCFNTAREAFSCSGGMPSILRETVRDAIQKNPTCPLAIFLDPNLSCRAVDRLLIPQSGSPISAFE